MMVKQFHKKKSWLDAAYNHLRLEKKHVYIFWEKLADTEGQSAILLP